MIATRLSIAKPKDPVSRVTQTTVDTIMVTPASIEKWKSPSFQRPMKENAKVLALAEEFKHNGGVFPGVITLGVLNGETYIIDGQHRKAAFLISGVPEGYMDVRIHHVSSIAEMGEEFVQLNSQLVRMGPDDILRGLEGSNPSLKKIRVACPYVGYNQVRRSSPSSPMVSMSVLLRSWRGSAQLIPQHATGIATQQLADLPQEEVESLIHFMTEAQSAFGREPEYVRLWGSLNLTMCMWMYRRMVITPFSPKTPRLSRDQFRKCLMSLSADSDYLDWLVGRKLSITDRSPCFRRLREIFAARLVEDLGKKVYMPQPEWFHNSGYKNPAKAHE